MTAVEAIDISRQAIIVLLKMGVPVMLIALIVGLSVSLLQALTQIQEMTLAFVPKIIVIFASLLMFLPFMMSTLTGFTRQVMDKVVSLG
jgi:flagellar biosynthetic protein FliQ